LVPRFQDVGRAWSEPNGGGCGDPECTDYAVYN
jgi:hypothetical protein